LFCETALPDTFALMKNLGHEATRDLMLLSVVAGSADAAGFMGGHVFTSNMTGNLVLLGIAFSQNQWQDVGKTLYVLALFVIGSILGSRMARRFPEAAWKKMLKRLLTVEAFLLLAFAVYWAFISEAAHTAQFLWLAMPLAMAMGLQSAAMNRLTIAGVTNTAMTGTLTNFAVGLESVWLHGFHAEAEVRRRIKKQLVVILLYCGAAATEGFLIFYAGWAMGFLPALFAILAVIAHRKD
jgi:uncharacterized membrane protein YoaK (UPF0700 family)